jgi:hypothetical protein
MPRTCRRPILIALAAAMLASTAGQTLVLAQDEYQKVNFFLLQNFDYNPKEKFVPTPHKVDNPPIPEFVKSIDGRNILIFGTTMPLDYKSGIVTEFILGVSADTCEYGATPRINEWIAVTLAGGKKAQVIASGEGWVRGVFHVQELVENGKVVRLYSIDADSVK